MIVPMYRRNFETKVGNIGCLVSSAEVSYQVSAGIRFDISCKFSYNRCLAINQERFGRVKKSNSKQRFDAIAVGAASDDFVQYTMDLLDESGVDFILCGDVYSAVVTLAKSNEVGNILIIGRLEQLSREEGHLFQKLRESSLVCCCFAGGNLVHRQKQILTAMEAGAFVIEDPGRMRELIAKFSAGDLAYPLSEIKDKNLSTFDDEFTVTEAEMDALLGG